MSQLYFTSSKISDERFNSLEHLFTVINPARIILIFDTNIVIDFRDFYFNAKTFSTDPKFKSTYESIKYLVEKIDHFDLEIGAQFALEESCRSIKDFKLNYAKAEQTKNALLDLFSMNTERFLAHIEKELSEKQIIEKEDFPESKIDCLKEESTHQFIIIASYLVSLKIYDLMMQIEKNESTHSKAMIEFLDFLNEVVDVFSVSFISYAFHIFGGYSALKPLIFSQERRNENKRLHKIFNGSIDLIFPHIADTSQSTYMSQNNSNLIPVFVTRDKYISILHSVLNTYDKFDDSQPNFKPIQKIASFKYVNYTRWSTKEMIALQEYIKKINDLRIPKSMMGPRASLHLIDKVKFYEDNAKRHF